jgi:hypothetical protein
MAANLAPGTQDHDVRLRKINKAQRRYNRRVGAYVRHYNKHRLTHKPATTAEVSSYRRDIAATNLRLGWHVDLRRACADSGAFEPALGC